MIREDSVFSVNGYRCRCGHEWVNKSLRNAERPRVCPRCKSPNWDREYKFRRGGKREEKEGGKPTEEPKRLGLGDLP